MQGGHEKLHAPADKRRENLKACIFHRHLDSLICIRSICAAIFKVNQRQKFLFVDHHDLYLQNLPSLLDFALFWALVSRQAKL